MASSSGDTAELKEVTKYFGSKAYYSGELLKDSRYQYSEDSETITVTLESRDKVTMWSYAIDVRDSEDPERELPERGFNEEEDYVLFHYTDEEGFRNITSSKEVWASLSPQTDSNFGFGVYCARKAPHQWRSKKEMFLNNFLPSKKDWEERKHLDFEEWPRPETLHFSKPQLQDRDLESLLRTQFGKALLKKWQPTGKCNFCIPIVCDYNSAQDVMVKDTFAGNMDNGKTRRAGENKFKEKEPRWRDVWTIVKFEKRNLQSNPGEWEMKMRNASAPAGLVTTVLQQRLAKLQKVSKGSAGYIKDQDADAARREAEADAAAAATCCNDNILYAAGSGNLPAVRHILRQNPAAVHVTSAGLTPLHQAAIGGHPAVAQLLLEHQASLDARDQFGDTPLDFARQCGRAELVEILEAAAEAEAARRAAAQAAANATAKAEEEAEAAARHEAEADTKFARKCGDNIFTAAINGNLPAVRHLLRQRPAAVHETSLGRTPLHWAAYNGRIAVAELLVERRASLEARDDSGKAPLDYARENRHNEVAQILKAAARSEGAQEVPKGPAGYIKEQEAEAARRAAAQATAKVRAEAAEGARREADPDAEEARNCNNDIFTAAVDGNLPAVRHLLRQNPAAARQTGGWGRTVLHYVAVRLTPLRQVAIGGHTAVARLLLEHRASLEARDRDGKTPLDLARENRRTELAQILEAAARHGQSKKCSLS